MKGVRSLSGYSFFLMSVVVAPVVLFITTPAFADPDDWSLVSAPPPPGPYRAVNLDPRIPGQGGAYAAENIPPLQQEPGDTFSEPVAPASGGLANYQAPVNRLPPQVPGVYQNRMYRPPVTAYPGPPGYPAQMGRPDYGAMPPRGYYPGPVEQVVPPPPVYDAMMRAPPGAYQSHAGRR